MARNRKPQCFVLKISSSRLKKAKWNLKINLHEARTNRELVALGESQVIRWIDELNGKGDNSGEFSRIIGEIRAIRRQESSVQNRHQIKKLYERLDELQFYPDYVTVVFEKNSDYRRACKGFKINDVPFTRLLGTAGGIKNSTIVFVSSRLAPELLKRIDNGRNPNVPLNAAKFEAYRALTCSHTLPVSMPKGILVVKDCHTLFKEHVIEVDDSGDGEPSVREVDNYEIDNNADDGNGMILPSLAKRWSEELDLGYVACGFNHRFSYSKGMLFTFDFIEFAETVAHQDWVDDIWGHRWDIHDIELVISESVLKLWFCYDSLDHYLACCRENHYDFGIPKMCPEKLEDVHSLNYQFLASYELSDEDIDELIAPTMNMIDDVLSGDYRKALLYAKGTRMNEQTPLFVPGRMDECEPVDSLMIEPKMFNDPLIKSMLRESIRKRITNAKIGVLDVHGNYSIACGDLYALCQSMFGMEVTGLLKAGELYNKYWLDDGAEEVVAFRAPMSAHNNIRKCRIANSDEVRHWFQYITTGTVVNAWSSFAAALNGMDYDGDLVMLTNNRVLVDNWRDEPTIFCIQKSATKKIVTEEDLIESNIAGFGNEIGAITNRITAMYDIMSQYPVNSAEYETLKYRITSGQNYQQNAIDRIKGIISKPMPRYWYDYHANKLGEDATDEEIAKRDFNLSIMVERKPYFMRYVYPALNKEYRTFISNTQAKSLMLFSITPEELFAIPADERTEEQNEFVRFYQQKIPVTDFQCVINKVCHKFEKHYDGKAGKMLTDSSFDTHVLRSDASYNSRIRNDIQRIYQDYVNDSNAYVIDRKGRKNNAEERQYNEELRLFYKREFIAKCHAVCSNDEELLNALIDVCYSKKTSKLLLWDVCKEVLFERLLRKHDYAISYPTADSNGDIVYKGEKFTMTQRKGVYIGTEADYIE